MANTWRASAPPGRALGETRSRPPLSEATLALQRQQLVQRGAAIGLVVGEDHPLHDRDAAFAEEHVLGAAQADAARAEVVGQLRLIGQVGVGAHAQTAELVGP